jgi:lipopolysaccharide export system permease protein
MIKIATRYIGWHVCKMILLILLILAALQLVMGFVGDLSQIGKGSYSFLLAIYCLLLALPMQLYALFSVVAFLGVVLSLGLLIQRNELVVFRASGLSLYRLLGIVLRTVFLLLVVVTYCGEWVAPNLNKQAVTLKQHALYRAGTLVHHYWWKNDDQFYFIRAARNETHVTGLGVIQLPQVGEGAGVSYAATAVKHGNDWLAPHEVETKLEPTKVAVLQLKNQSIPAKLHIASSQVARHAVNQESVFNLRQVIKERKLEGRSVGRFQVAYWGRQLQPIATLVLVLLGVPIVFTQIRRSTGGSRLLIGIAIGFIFYLINQLLAPIGVLLLWPPALVVLLPILVFLVIGIILMQRVSR